VPAPRAEHRRRRRRFLLAVLAAAVLAAAMSGCIIIKSVSSTQLNTIGGVQVTTVLCATDKNSDNTGYSPADSSCQGNTTDKLGNSNTDTVNNFNLQLQIAYRIPSTATAPSTITSVNTSNPPTTACGGGIVFNQSASYSAALEAGTAAGSGKQWVGYLSTTQNFTTAGCNYITLSPTFSLNQAADGTPFQTPFTYRVVAGWRQVNDSQPGNTSARNVTCGSSPFASYSDGVDANSDGNLDMSGICIDYPTGGASAIASDSSQATRDLGIVAGSAQSVHAATTATVPFTVKYSGAAGAGPFTMSATTTVPSTTATPSQTTYTPSANGNQAMTVSVPVPAGTTAGTYNVTLKADLGNGQIRQQTNTVTVGTCFCFETSPALPSLPTVTLNGQAQTKTAQMGNFAVNDTNGTSGWNVTVIGDASAGKSAVFKEYCPGPSACGSVSGGTYATGGKTLAANSLTLNTTGASWTGGGGATPTFSCNAGCSVDRAAAIKIASAASGGGTGLWSSSGFGASSLSLAAPTTMRALSSGEQYHVDVVWSLNSGP
jgi:hypothetical protein